MPLVLPQDFDAPRHWRAEDFQLEVLSPAHAALDFEAVRGNAERIRHIFGPESDWPSASLSYEENLADLIRHEAEFERREAFAYAMLDPTGTQYLGCLYIKPIKSRLAVDLRRERFQAQAFFWLSEAGLALGTDTVLRWLTHWVHQAWPFAAVAFPGRAPAWAEWKAMAMPAP